MHISEFFNYNFLFDSHAHLNASDYDIDRDDIVNRSIREGVKYIFDIGTDIDSSIKSINNSKKYLNKVYSFVGIDPECFIPGSSLFIGLDKDTKWFEEMNKKLKTLINENIRYIKGIGETGIDLYWLQKSNHNDINKSYNLQLELFKLHLNLAQEFNLPLSIHSRGAEAKCLEIVKDYNITGIFHSYTGDYKTAIRILDHGWGLGINGIITFKNAKELKDMFKRILGKTVNSLQDFYTKGIFFETDSPFLSPEGKRGLRNEPSNVKDIYEMTLKL